ncbi:MAG: NYN domain-containing protein [Paracoccaceae bacterium]
MPVPFILFLVSFAAALFGFGLTGTLDSGPVMLALLSALAALVLLARVPGRRTPKRSAPKPGARKRVPAAPPRSIVVDGSNVMHWKDGTAQMATVQEVIRALSDQGYQPGVIFDANAGYKLAGRYLDDRPLARALGLSADRVLVVPKGEPADPVILKVARDLGAPVVSDDRFRDWVAEFPEVAQPGHLRRGGYRDGVLWLETGVNASCA